METNYTEAREMAMYILTILKRSTMVYFSWGVTNLQALPQVKLENGEVTNIGLRFKANGLKHKGWVRIEYDGGTDYFNVILEKKGKVKSIDCNTKTKVTDIDFETLAEVVDRLIEKTDNYEEDLTEEFKRLAQKSL